MSKKFLNQLKKNPWDKGNDLNDLASTFGKNIAEQEPAAVVSGMEAGPVSEIASHLVSLGLATSRTVSENKKQIKDLF